MILSCWRATACDVAPLAFDTMIAEWLTNPASHNLGLKNLAWVRQGIKMTNIEELIGKGKNQITMAQVPICTGRRSMPLRTCESCCG